MLIDFAIKHERFIKFAKYSTYVKAYHINEGLF